MDLRAYIRDIPDFPKPGVLFKDITPLLADPAAFGYAIASCRRTTRHRAIDAIAAAEARGFLFAAPLALRLHKPLVPLRKPGKLPYRTHSLQVRPGVRHRPNCTSTPTRSRRARACSLVDDVLATGGTMAAACQLIEQAGGTVVGCAFLVELSFLKGRKAARRPRRASA